MAVKNYQADKKIKEAAVREFLKYGYRDASLRRIAEEAGITTGSIYMRYQSKDALFTSLVQVIPEETEKAFRDLLPVYQGCRTAADMMKAVQKESETVMHILFDHYDEATLLLCRSQGSSCENFLDELTHQKIMVSEQFFSGFPDAQDLKNAFELLISSQFDLYRKILEKGYTRKEAETCMSILTEFLKAGWQSIMQQLISKRGD